MEIAKKVEQTSKKVIENIDKNKWKSVSRNVTNRNLSKIKNKKCELKIIEEGDVANVNNEKDKLWILAKNMKAAEVPHLNKYHKEKHVCSAKKYIKTDFLVIFSDDIVALKVIDI